MVEAATEAAAPPILQDGPLGPPPFPGALGLETVESSVERLLEGRRLGEDRELIDQPVRRDQQDQTVALTSLVPYSPRPRRPGFTVSIVLSTFTRKHTHNVGVVVVGQGFVAARRVAYRYYNGRCSVVAMIECAWPSQPQRWRFICDQGRRPVYS